MDANYIDPLTMPELGNLWMQYINDSMSKCMLKHFLAIVEDNSIRGFLKFAFELSCI